MISKVFNRPFKFKTGNTILFLLFIASLGLTVWAINIYRLTIIDTNILIIVCAVGALIAFFAIRLLIKSTYSKFWTLFICIVVGSGIFYFGLLFLNQTFSDKAIMKEYFQIVKKGGRSRKTRCFHPYVVIDFHGKEKQLVFYCDFAETIKLSSKVNLAYSKGLFGFDIIRSKLLIQ